MEILDMECAECGYELSQECIDNDDSFLRNALGVLKEDGLYAFFLFLSAKDKDKGQKISKRLFEFLKQKPPLQDAGQEYTDLFKAIREKWADNLPSLLFAKELIERVMVYAIYHVKAKEKGGS